MSFVAPALNVFVNFLAASRKRLLIPSGFFGPDDNIGFIWNADPGVPVALTGTMDGVNATFTLPSAYTGTLFLYKNGVLQLPTTMYTVSGTTVTFLDPYLPQAGDYLSALVG